MTEFFTPAQIAQLSAGDVRMGVLVELGFDPIMHYWNGNMRLEAGGRLWHGFADGALISLEGLVEGRGTESAQIMLNLSGTTPEINLLALQTAEDQADKVVEIFFQFFDVNWQVTGVPVSVWLGISQPMTVTFVKGEDGEEDQRSISLPAENLFYNRSRPAGGRYTAADLERRFPGDRFCDYMPRIKYGTNYIFP